MSIDGSGGCAPAGCGGAAGEFMIVNDPGINVGGALAVASRCFRNAFNSCSLTDRDDVGEESGDAAGAL